jgi:hypothetical protein
VTVRDWLETRPRRVSVLSERVLLALGTDADAPREQTADVCLSAAARCLGVLISSQRFERDSALDLLTVDALTTYAFEYASDSSRSAEEMTALARRGAHLLGQLTTQRV